jgi:asparagine synthase (glutamine-hydrolysing)
MNEAILHRGPDDGGVWTDEHVGVGLANRRLAILDLSSNGHQPMTSRCGRYVLVYNGEVYNFGSLRDELEREGAVLRGHTDTEVILEGCARWGLARTVERLNGMFAFALWDRAERKLSLVRDRIGIKPLYYARIGTSLLFGSELKALCAHPLFDGELDRNSVDLFLRYSYIPAPWSIYRYVRKLTAGHILTLSAPDGDSESVPYWSIRTAAEQTSAISESEAIDELQTLLSEAIRLQMISDVPLGAFLSGGIDSSTVVGLMQTQSTRRVKTFSIGFADARYDEAKHARQVAQHLGTEHTELYVGNEQLLDAVPQLASVYDEPFADPSQIPTAVLAALTRKEVTVALSGDGGDELFAGYSHYRQVRDRWTLSRRIPEPLRVGAAATFDWVTANGNSTKFATLRSLLTAQAPESVGSHARSRKALLGIVKNVVEPQTAFTDRAQWPDTDDVLTRLMCLDLNTYLPEDVLTKVDRATMQVSLEARVPILDHRIVEFALQLPNSFKLRRNQNKWLLRKVLERFVPASLFDRPKMGFSVPISDWLRGPLRDWAESLLDVATVRTQGLLDPVLVRRMWDEHVEGQRDWGHVLWNLTMLQAWRSRWVP